MTEHSKIPAVSKQIIGEEGAHQRLDNFLLRLCKGVPKSHIYRIVRSGEVRVNGRRAKVANKLQIGDEVRIPPMRLAVPARPGPNKVPPREFSIVHEDEALLVIDKPSGLAVHGGSGISYGVIEQLRRQRPEARFLELVHRLDRETSGLLIVAKKRASLTALHDALREGRVRKYYKALVRGRWMDPLRHIRVPLHKYLTETGERRVSVSDDGKVAHSIVGLAARWENFSLVDVELKTGRTHQIRVHLAHLGFPICGDDKYGDFTLNRMLQSVSLKRMFLHSTRLQFLHPISGEALALEAALPAELLSCLASIDDNERREHG